METQNISGPVPTMGHAENEGVTVTPAAIEAEIASEHYFTAYEGVMGERFNHSAGDKDVGEGRIPNELKLLTFCVLRLKNGFTVTGQSACADPRKFNQEIGEKVARGDAIRQVWPLMGYVLRDQLHKLDVLGADDDKLGEALTHMIAHRLGNPEAFRPDHAEAILQHFTATALEQAAD